MGELRQMSDERCEEIPFVPEDEVRAAAPSAPQPTSLSEADRRCLEALLRELLRDNSLRELLCKEEV
jgi:hypothetical protein